MKKLEYSQIVRKKLKELRANLTLRFGEQGKSVSAMFDVDCDYRCLFVSHNYLFYRIEKDKVIIAELPLQSIFKSVSVRDIDNILDDDKNAERKRTDMNKRLDKIYIQ